MWDWQAGNNSVNVLWPIVARTDVSLTPNNFSRELKPPVIASPTSGFRLRLPQRDDTKSICVIQRELFVIAEPKSLTQSRTQVRAFWMLSRFIFETSVVGLIRNKAAAPSTP